ncbi:MAG: response regulator transcription factor, partial [Phycisphaerales bacterium]|nr:response regulator transcription factor [Phycisphaerales bacterium]
THPGVAILLLSQYVEVAYAQELLAAGSGGVGYLLKDRVVSLDEVRDALERVAAGGTVLDPEVVGQLMARRVDPLAALTPREREVLDWLAEGSSNKAIARELDISPRTVEIHRANMMTKLGARHAAEAVRLKLEAKLEPKLRA